MRKCNLTLLAIWAMCLLFPLHLFAQTDHIQLPFVFCNQTRWEAAETTIRLSENEEEMPAYELKGFSSNGRMSCSGTVYYVPSSLDDRLILLFKDVQITKCMLPAIIDNPSSQTIIVHMHGRTVLQSEGSIIRTKGPVCLIGEETDEDLDFNHTADLLTTGKSNRPAISAVGDVQIQDLKVEIKSSHGNYAILTTEEKEQSVLVLNHVTGVISGQKESTFGFSVIETTNAQVDGIQADTSDNHSPSMETPSEEDVVYTLADVDEEPKFDEGSYQQFAKWANENVQYPVIAQESGIQGRVFVQFTVGADGKVRDVKILRGVDNSLDKAAVMIIESSPVWTPAKIDGRNVACIVSTGVQFHLKK